jgi:hypothetical protein
LIPWKTRRKEDLPMRRLVPTRRLAIILSGLLLIPVGEVAASGTVRSAPSPKECGSTVALLASLRSSDIPPASGCLQDQYGDQWNFFTDFDHRSFAGTVTMAQGCADPTFHMIGSYVRRVFAFTAINPLGDGDPNCIATFMVKGAYPNSAWFYDTGFGAQEFTWAMCGTTPAADPLQAHVGARR